MPKLIDGFSFLLVALVACEGKPAAITTHPVEAIQTQPSTADTTNSATVVALLPQDTLIHATQPTSSKSGDVPALHKLFEEVRSVTPGLQVVIESVPVADSTIIREPSDLKLTFAIRRNNKIIYRDTTDDGLGREDKYLSVNQYSQMHRHEIMDRQWALVAPLLSGKATDCSVTVGDSRLFFSAVVWFLRTGAAWADLPERFGKPNSVCRRFRRLAQKQVWEAVFKALQAPELDWVMLNSTVLRAHQHAAGQKK